MRNITCEIMISAHKKLTLFPKQDSWSWLTKNLTLFFKQDSWSRLTKSNFILQTTFMVLAHKIQLYFPNKIHVQTIEI